MKPFTPHPDGRLLTVEDLPHLDASELAWSGIIERGADGDMWPFDDLAEETDLFAYRNPAFAKLDLVKLARSEHGDGKVRLGVSFKTTHYSSRGEDWISDDWRQFTLVSTRPHYGGKRWWFECAGCGKRRVRVYLSPCQYALCRVCLNLTYETRQQHNHASRHGSGWRSFRHSFHHALRAEALRRRRSLRRRVRRSGELKAS